MTKIPVKTISLSNGETYAYREMGTGSKVLILLHGNMSSSLFFDELFEKMPEEEFKIIAPDMRGFGDSTYNTPVKKMKDFSDDLKLFVDALNLQNFALCGWSAGGIVAMQFAIDHPDYVNKLVLLASGSIKGFPVQKTNFIGKPIPGKYITSSEEMAKLFKPIINAYAKKKSVLVKMMINKSFFIVKKPDEERVAAYIEEIYKQRNLVDLNMGLTYFNISHEHNGVVEGSGEVDKITAPTLILQGDKDNIITEGMLQATLKGFGDRAKFVRLENCGHALITDCSEKIAQEIRAFIG
ncbi:MAG: alpha/beta hydrolase [Peptococcia bacterium]